MTVPAAAPATTRRVVAGDVELAVLEDGVGGRPLLLAHGYTGSKEDFGAWVAPLAAVGWHVVAPDHRGHGESDKPVGDAHYSLGHLADDVLALADALGWTSWSLVGHSMGGMVAQLVALSGRARLEALVLMDTHHGALGTLDPEIVALGAAIARSEGMDAIADVLASMEPPLQTPASVRFAAAHPEWEAFSEARLRGCSPHMYAAVLEEIAAAEDRLEALARLEVPTLVIVGDQDEPFVDASHAMATTIPGARLAVIAEAGHSPQLHNPDDWWSALSGFLGDVATGDR